MVDGIGPDPRSDWEESVSNYACPRCFWPLADEVDRAGTEAEHLASIASSLTLERTQLLAQLSEIMEGFKHAVEQGGQAVDGELGGSVGAILRSVNQVNDEMEKVASFAVALSSAKLAQMAESLRLDVRALLQAKNEQRGAI